MYPRGPTSPAAERTAGAYYLAKWLGRTTATDGSDGRAAGDFRPSFPREARVAVNPRACLQNTSSEWMPRQWMVRFGKAPDRVPHPTSDFMRRILSIPLACLLLSTAIGAEPKGVETTRSALERDLADGRLSQFTLFQAALIAGGIVDRDELDRRCETFDRGCRLIAAELSADPASASDSNGPRLHRLGRLTHGIWLTGKYDADCSSLVRTLDSGDYNCVTATILYQRVAEFCGESPQALATSSHVLTRLAGPTGDWFVETTCPSWTPVTLDDCPAKTREAALAGRELSAEELLGKVFYNQGVASLRGREFSAAADSLRAAIRLDPLDQAARENLLATLNNWALAECDAGRYENATRRLCEGLAIDPRYGPLQANDLHIHQRWIKQLCASRDYGRAIELLEDAARRRPDCEWFPRGLETVRDLSQPRGGTATAPSPLGPTVVIQEARTNEARQGDDLPDAGS